MPTEQRTWAVGDTVRLLTGTVPGVRRGSRGVVRAVEHGRVWVRFAGHREDRWFTVDELEAA